MAERADPGSTPSLAELSPAYFGMVMATGIVSIAADLVGLPALARWLLALNAAAYATGRLAQKAAG